MPEFPVNQFGRQLWQAAEKSASVRQIAQFIRSLGETESVTIKKTAANGLKKAGETLKTDLVILSDAVKKMRNKGGGSSGAPAEVWFPSIIEFPHGHKPLEVPKPSRKPEVPNRRLPHEKPLPKEFPGRPIPPEFPNRWNFPGPGEEGGLPPVPVILPPKAPKTPPLHAAAAVH